MQPLTTESPEPFLLENLLTQLLSAGGHKKQQLASELIDRISCDGSAPDKAAWIAYILLNSNKPGRVDDCLGVFSRLEWSIVRDAISDALSRRPPIAEFMDRWSADYWYVLIRTMLRGTSGADTPQRDALISIASQYPIDAIREAAVQALSEADNPNYVPRLQAIADGDPSLAIRQLAREAIEEARRSTS